jgi:hypothetical protein
MKSIKSERLKKFELELHDLDEWLRLGLVPKKDLEKHKEEMRLLQGKIDEEKERLQFLKEGGEGEEFIVPKRAPAKGAFNEMPTIPDIEVHESASGVTESGLEVTTYVTEETTISEEPSEEFYTAHEHEDEAAAEEGYVDEDKEEEEEEESYFSDRNRWRRGGIVDPDADEW